MIQRRELPAWFGSSPMEPWNFVASTTCSRRPPASALPTICSDSPPEYTSAVSMKLIPASSAWWMMRMDSSWSRSPQAPNIIAPRHRGLTFTPVRPSVRSSMRETYPDAADRRVLAAWLAACHAQGWRGPSLAAARPTGAAQCTAAATRSGQYLAWSASSVAVGVSRSGEAS